MVPSSKDEFLNLSSLFAGQVVFGWFEVELDSFSDVCKSLFPAFTLADAARQSGNVNRETAFFTWFENDLESHFGGDDTTRS